jgi:hypothetical protein
MPIASRVTSASCTTARGLEAGCAVEIALRWTTRSDPSSYQQEQEADPYSPEAHQRLTKKNGALECVLPGGLPLLHIRPHTFVAGHG